MTNQQICDRLDRIEQRAADPEVDVSDDIAALRLDIEIDARRAEDAKRAPQGLREVKVA